MRLPRPSPPLEKGDEGDSPGYSNPPLPPLLRGGAELDFALSGLQKVVMAIGKSFKAALALSLAAHASLVAAMLLVAGSAAEEKRRVFMVELREARLVSPGGGSAAEAEKPPQAPSAANPRREAVAEKKIPVASSDLPVEEAISEERARGPATAPAEAPAPSGEAGGSETASGSSGDASLVSEGSSAGAGEGRALEAGRGGFAPSPGPALTRAEALARIRKAIEEELTYPPLARRRKMEGTVVAGFSIDGRGAPADIRVVRSSGYPVLDNEVVEIIRRAAPYPRLSERVEVPVSFRLIEGR